MQLNPSRAVKQQKSRLKNSVPCLLTADGFPDLKHGDGWPLSTHESGPPPPSSLPLPIHTRMHRQNINQRMHVVNRQEALVLSGWCLHMGLNVEAGSTKGVVVAREGVRQHGTVTATMIRATSV